MEHNIASGPRPPAVSNLFAIKSSTSRSHSVRAHPAGSQSGGAGGADHRQVNVCRLAIGSPRSGNHFDGNGFRPGPGMRIP